MRRTLAAAAAAAIAASAPAACGGSAGSTGTEGTASPAKHANGPYIAAAKFSDPARIDNPYAPLSEFRRCEYSGAGGTSTGVRTLLDRTQPFEVNGQKIEAAVFEDKATEDGRVVERTIDYFAQSDDGTVFYLGEDVNNYANGKVKNHEGSWRLGQDTEVPGVLMPGSPEVGDRWNFEYVPGITIEANTLTGRSPSREVGGKTYKDVVSVREHLVLEDEIEGKLFARGTGLVREMDADGTHADLVRCS